MPFIPFHSGISDVRIGLWKVVEEEMFFLTKLKMYDHEWSRLDKIVHPKKRLEWLSSRLIMKELLKIGHLDRIQSLNADNGKPYLSNNSHFISYTHSGNYSAAIASESHEVGIDLEHLVRKRNTSTYRKFMTESEANLYLASENFELFILIWSAKETLYKIFGQKGVIFRQDIMLDLNFTEPQRSGVVPAVIRKNGSEQYYHVRYAFQDDYLLTYTVDGAQEPVLPQMVH